MTITGSKNQLSIFQKCEDDGLIMRKSNVWTEIKLGYLINYLTMFTTSMRKKPWRALHYIDLFSGPGKCMLRKTKKVVLGSPLLGLTLKYPFNRYFFVDNDPNMIAALKIRSNSINCKADVYYFAGDSNQEIKKINEIIQNIDREYIRGKWPSLNLAFLDPEGLEVNWETIVSLAKLNRIDLIIYYPQMGLNRVMKKCYDSETPNLIDRFFGGNKWRKLYQQNRNSRPKYLHRALLDYYEDNLESLGFQVLRGSEPLIRNVKKNAPLYRLIFASKHKLGLTFWNEAIQKDIHGQYRLL